MGEIKVTFFYARRTVEIQIQYNDNNKMSLFFQNFVKKLNSNLTIDDFNFFYEGHILDKDSLISKNNNIYNKEKINLSAERKLRIIKCPKCLSNNSIINIDNYKIIFSDCKYDHIENKLFNEYENLKK